MSKHSTTRIWRAASAPRGSGTRKRSRMPWIGIGLVLAMLPSCNSSEPSRAEAEPSAGQAGETTEALRWCKTELTDVDWKGDPERALAAYARASHSCSELLHEKHHLAGLSLVTYHALGKPLPIRTIRTDPKERVRQLLNDGIELQSSISYAVSGPACEGNSAGTSLVRMRFKANGLESFAPAARTIVSELARGGLSMRSVGGGVAVTIPPDPGARCATTFFVGQDELIAVQALEATAIDALIEQARARS